jgi:hypothetical protein
MESPQWFLDNEIVEIEIYNIGRTRNRMIFETYEAQFT